MKLVGIINEPPFDPISWSGSAKYFFSALQREGVLAGAFDVNMSRGMDRVFRAINFRPDLAAWREHYHLDPRRFRWLSKLAVDRIREVKDATGVLQIGAWYSVADKLDVPCFSYHDGNLALRLKSGHIGLPAESAPVRRALQWERKTYERLTAMFPMSEWLAQSFVRDFGVPESKVHAVGAGLNFDDIPPPAPADREYAPRFLMVGKDFERKGGPVLLRAFVEVRRQVPKAELIIIGPTLGSLPDGVTCLGFLSKRDPRQLAKLTQAYASAGVYVLPSLYEPFGISLLEGMANSLPCIAANHCAMPEIIAHGKTGFVVTPGDADALAQAMIEIARQPDMAREFGRAGRNRLLERYTWSAVAAKIAAITRAHA